MLVSPTTSIAQQGSDTLPRLGQINFVNCLPVVVPMRRSDWQQNAHITYANPAELNLAFEQNLLDIGAMSSFYFLKNGTLRLVENLSISSDGAVASVMCYSKKPLSMLQSSVIAVPTSSATSVNLLLVLLKEVFNIRPYLKYSSNPCINDDEVDAALVIGDQALDAELFWSRKLVRADLGEWWRIVTGLPMVFGVWAAKMDWAEKNPLQFAAISASLVAAVKTGLSADFAEVVAEGCTRTGMSETRIQQYFKRDLNYEMTARHIEGLELYGDLCVKHGLFDLHD